MDTTGVNEPKRVFLRFAGQIPKDQWEAHLEVGLWERRAAVSAGASLLRAHAVPQELSGTACRADVRPHD